MIQKFQIDGWHPISVNKMFAMHWAKRGKMKKQDAEIVKLEGISKNITQAKGKRVVRVTVVLGPKQKRPPDDDNLRKSLQDALVKAGYLIDDSAKLSTFEPFVYLRGPQKATIIELEDFG